MSGGRPLSPAILTMGPGRTERRMRAESEAFISKIIPLVVSWAYGTIDANGNCPSSHLRNYWCHWAVTFILSLHDYVVAALDYVVLELASTLAGASKHTPI